MLSFLYPLSSPKVFYRWTSFTLPWLKGFSILFLFVGLVFALGFSPPDYQQGETVRMMYIHVPSAFLSMACYGVMGVLAAVLLIWQIKLAGVLLRGVAFLGAMMAGLALITGSIWGKPMWGTWWVWDARLTSELILWMLYLAILAIQKTFRQREYADRAMAMVTLIGLVDLPIIHYSVYWWNTLHQGSSFSWRAKPLIDASMLWPLGLMLIGFIFLGGWVVLQYARSEILLREARSQWVRNYLAGEER